MDCPCGSGRPHDACCGPILAGAPAPTAEALMRSRYSAYVLGTVDHIVATHDPGKEEVDRDAIAKWSKEAEWKGLEVRSTEAGGPDDTEGTVEFFVRYRQGGHDLSHHERSQFVKRDGRWMYKEGTMIKPPPARAVKAAGRNDPCPCGSGMKYKRCHGK